jgi:hypothetical protein
MARAGPAADEADEIMVRAVEIGAGKPKIGKGLDGTNGGRQAATRQAMREHDHDVDAKQD